MATSPASPLLIATLLLQSKPQLASLHHVADAITSFLDTSVELPLHKACKFGSLELLSRIWSSTVDLPQGDSSWSVRRLLHSEKFYQQFQFTHSLVEAAKQKDLGMTRWLFERFPACDVRREAVEEAAKAGALEILQYFHENGKNMNSYIDDEGDSDVEQRHVFWGYEDAVLAARAGYSDVVRWLYNFADSHTRCEQKVTRTVIETGCVALIEWLWQRLDAPPHEGMLGAAANGHAQMLELLEYEGCSTNPFAIIVRAAEVGQLNVVRWAFESIRNRPSQPSWEAGLAVHNAVVNGHLEVAKYIYARINDEDESQGKENLAAWKKAVMSVLAPESNCAAISRETVILAAERGFAEAVQWLWTEFGDGLAMEALSVMNDAEMTFACPLDAAASNGHLEIMKYLATIDAEENKKCEQNRQRLRFIDEVRGFAPSTNSLQSAVTASFNSAPSVGCTIAAMDGAAANGHLDAVRWLHQNRVEGCSTKAMDLAAKNGHLEMVKWLHHNRSEGCTAQAIDTAASGGHFEVVKWLSEHRHEGCTTQAMDGAAACGHLDMVKWLQANRAEGCSTAAMDGACACGALDVVKWLYANRSEGCTTAGMDEAAGKGHLQVIRWLHENRQEGCTAAAMDKAILASEFETVILLFKMRREGCSRAMAYTDSISLDIHRFLGECFKPWCRGGHGRGCCLNCGSARAG